MQLANESLTGTCTCRVDKYAVGKERRFSFKTRWVLEKTQRVLRKNRPLLTMPSVNRINIHPVYNYTAGCKKCKKCNIKRTNDNYTKSLIIIENNHSRTLFYLSFGCSRIQMLVQTNGVCLLNIPIEIQERPISNSRSLILGSKGFRVITFFFNFTGFT